MAAQKSRTELKREAQDQIMNGIANVLGYWDPHENGVDIPDEQMGEFKAIMRREADRVAKLFGFEKAWTN